MKVVLPNALTFQPRDGKWYNQYSCACVHDQSHTCQELIQDLH